MCESFVAGSRGFREVIWWGAGVSMRIDGGVRVSWRVGLVYIVGVDGDEFVWIRGVAEGGRDVECWCYICAAVQRVVCVDCECGW